MRSGDPQPNSLANRYAAVRDNRDQLRSGRYLPSEYRDLIIENARHRRAMRRRVEQRVGRGRPLGRNIEGDNT